MEKRDTKPGKIKSAILNWLGVYDWLAGGGGAVYGQSDTGLTVTSDKALTLSAVWACTRLISQTVSTLPIDIYERVPDGSRSAASDLRTAKIIHSQPNPDMTSAVFWEAFVVNILQGNGFAEKLYMGNVLVGLDLLCTERLSWNKTYNGGYEYTYIDDNGTRRTIEESKIFHVPGFTTTGKFGMSAIRYGAQVFGAGLAANSAANSTFKNGLAPTMAYTVDRILKPEQREDFRTAIAAISGAVNSGKTAVLEQGMDVKPIGINPADAQLLESRVFSGEEVCRWYGVDPSMVGFGGKDSNWGTGLEEKNIRFLQYTLNPILRKIEQAIWMQLLSPSEQRKYYAEFTVEGLLRANLTARTAFYASALQNGYMNRDRVAILENQPKIPGGDIYTVQSNLVPLDKIGSLIVSGSQDGSTEVQDETTA